MRASFPRKIEPQIEKQLGSEQALVVTGMRRVGKTTLMRRIYNTLKTNNKKWFDFENPLDVKKFEEIDYNHIVSNLELSKDEKMYVFIDEIQNFTEVTKIMKYLIDHWQIKFIVTGSASYYLKNLFPESLAGRKRIFELFPLDFGEFLEFKGVANSRLTDFREKSKYINLVEYERFSKLFDEFNDYGGFPEVVLESDPKEKRNRLGEIFSSYYEKEIVGLSGFRKNKEVRDLILLLAVRVGGKLDISKISQELGITRISLYNYLNFLKDSYFISLIYPFSRSVDREISGRPKIYFCDTGLLKVISQINSGQILENTVFNLIKSYGKVNYYQRRKSEQEIDFVLNESIGLEVKETGTSGDLLRLGDLSQSLSLKEFYVISRRFNEKIDKVIYPQFL